MRGAVRSCLVATVVVVLAAAASGWCVSTDALLRNQVGDSFFEQGDFDAAVKEYREAVRLAPDYARARYNLATVLDLKLGRGAEALEHYRAYLTLTPVPLEIVAQRILVIEEEHDYAALMGHLRIEDAEAYLARFPRGKHAAEVREYLSKLIDSRRKEEEAAREQQRRELEALGDPDLVERWAWLWKTWEIRWFRQAGTALIFSGGALVRKVPFPPFDRQNDEQQSALRKEILDRLSAERAPVVIVTPSKMTTSGLLDHVYLAARERFRSEGSYLVLSSAYDRSLKDLIENTSTLEPAEFIYLKRNDITGEDTKVAMPGYRAKCDISPLPLTPLGSLSIPIGSKISRIRVGDEAINVIPGQTIPLPADRYRIEAWAGNIMQREDVTLEPRQTVSLTDPQ